MSFYFYGDGGSLLRNPASPALDRNSVNYSDYYKFYYLSQRLI